MNLRQSNKLGTIGVALIITGIATMAVVVISAFLFFKAKQQRTKQHAFIKELNVQGLELMRSNHVEAALSVFVSIRSFDSNDVPAIANSSLALNRLGRHTEALSLADRAIQLRSNCVEAIHNKAVAFNGLEQPPNALLWTERALHANPEYAPAWVLKGVLLQRRGETYWSEAMACYERALAVDRNSRDASIYKGKLLLDQRQYGKAQEVYKVLEEKYADDPEVNHLGIVTAFRMQEPAEALRIADRRFKRDPNNADLLNDRGLALYQLGRIDEASASLQRSIVLKPESAPAWNNLALALHRKGKTDEALEALNRALAIHPGYPQAKTNLSWIRAH